MVDQWGAVVFEAPAVGNAARAAWLVGNVRVGDFDAATVDLERDDPDSPAVVVQVPGHRVIAVVRGEQGDQRVLEVAQMLAAAARSDGR